MEHGTLLMSRTYALRRVIRDHICREVHEAERTLNRLGNGRHVEPPLDISCAVNAIRLNFCSRLHTAGHARKPYT